MTLRAKLLLAQAPLAIALVLVGVLSARHQRDAGAQRAVDPEGQLPQRAGRQRMKEALERIDSAALFIVAGERERGS